MKKIVLCLLLAGVIGIFVIMRSNFDIATSRGNTAQKKTTVMSIQRGIVNDTAKATSLNQRLLEINKEIEKRRLTIINDYSRKERGLKESAGNRLMKLAVDEQAAKKNNKRQLTDAKSKASGKDVTNKVKDISGKYQTDMERIAKEKGYVNKDLASTLAHLNVQKQYELDNLEKLKKKWTKEASEGACKPVQETIDAAGSQSDSTNNAKTNIITAIVASGNNKPSVLINGKIVSEGNLIEGVKVVSISKDEVEFEKNNTRWKQHIAQPPNPAWQQ